MEDKDVNNNVSMGLKNPFKEGGEEFKKGLDGALKQVENIHKDQSSGRIVPPKANSWSTTRIFLTLLAVILVIFIIITYFIYK